MVSLDVKLKYSHTTETQHWVYINQLIILNCPQNLQHYLNKGKWNDRFEDCNIMEKHNADLPEWKWVILTSGSVIGKRRLSLIKLKKFLRKLVEMIMSRPKREYIIKLNNSTSLTHGRHLSCFHFKFTFHWNFTR